MKAIETSDVELFALAALVARETAIVNGQIAQYGQPMQDPITPASVKLESLLCERGVLARSEG